VSPSAEIVSVHNCTLPSRGVGVLGPIRPTLPGLLLDTPCCAVMRLCEMELHSIHLDVMLRTVLNMKDKKELDNSTGASVKITLQVVGVLGIAAGVFFGRPYFFRELVLLVCIAAIVALFAANLVVLGILFLGAGQSILQPARAAKPAAAQEKVNAERQSAPFLGSPAVSPAGLDGT